MTKVYTQLPLSFYFKRCSKCKQAKPAASFALNRARADGLQDECRECRSERRKESVAETREYQRQWRARQPPEVAAKRVREYRQAHPRRRLIAEGYQPYPKTPATRERARQRAKEYYRLDPERSRQHWEQRRARKFAAPVRDFTATQWREVCAYFANHCAYCNEYCENPQQEHMTPLSRGGSHTASNIVPACAACNLRKHARTLMEFFLP